MSDRNVNIVALANFITANDLKVARPNVAAGNHDVDVTIRVTGTISVGADYTTTPTVSVPLKETLALFIAYCGITREAAINLMTRAMTDAISQTGKGKGALAGVDQVEQTIERVEATMASLPKQPRKGPVKTKLTYAEVAMVAA